MKPIKIEVKQSHIKRGMPADPCGCPVALAIRSRLRGRDFGVYGYIVEFRGEDEIHSAVPAKVRRFVDLFDSDDEDVRKRCKPFSFTLKQGKVVP